MNITFERYQASTLHEAGHAAMSVILNRALIEVAVIRDDQGDGYVHRVTTNAPGIPALEEIAIALAGEEAPYLWGSGWITNYDHDSARIRCICREHFPGQDPEQIEGAVRPCVKAALTQLRDGVSALAADLLIRNKIAGDEAESILRKHIPNGVGLRDCLAKVLQGISSKAIQAE